MTEQTLQIHQFSCLGDNYGYLAHDTQTGATAAIDTPEAGPILAALEETGWRLTHILNTHHHWDHSGGNLELKEKTGCQILGPQGEADAIPGIDILLGDGDQATIGAQVATVLEVPGHTRGHIAYWFKDAGVAFVGDALFALGCGRIFEGTPQQMWASLQKLRALPESTLVYCAHEYTQSNAAFALSVEPQNTALVDRSREIDQLRQAGKPTVPTTIGLEIKTNPFLRPESKDLQSTLEMLGAEPLDVFTETRRRKDNF